MTKVAGSSTRGFAGDGDSAVSAKLSSPADVVVHPSKNVIYIADGQNHRVRAVENGVITTVAGRRKRRGTVDMMEFCENEERGFCDDCTWEKAENDYRPCHRHTNFRACDVFIGDPLRLAVSKTHLYILLKSQFDSHRILGVDLATGFISNVAGVLSGKGYAIRQVTVGKASFEDCLYDPMSMCADRHGKFLYIADPGCKQIRQIDLERRSIVSLVGSKSDGVLRNHETKEEASVVIDYSSFNILDQLPSRLATSTKLLFAWLTMSTMMGISTGTACTKFVSSRIA